MIKYKIGDCVELRKDTYFCDKCLPKGTRATVIKVCKKSWLDDMSCIIRIDTDFYVQGVNISKQLGVMMSELKYAEGE